MCPANMEMSGLDPMPKTPGEEKISKSATASKCLGLEDHFDDWLGTGSCSPDRSYESADSEFVRCTVQSMNRAFAGADTASSVAEGSMTQETYKAPLRGNSTHSSAPPHSTASKKLENGPSLSDTHVQGTSLLKDCIQDTPPTDRPSQHAHHYPPVHLGKWSPTLSSRGRATPACSSSRDSMTDDDGDDDDDDDDEDLIALLPDSTRDSTTRVHSATKASTRKTQIEQSPSVPTSEKRHPSLTPTLNMMQGGAVVKTEKCCPPSQAEGGRYENKSETRRISQGRKGSSRTQASLNSGFPGGDSDLEEILNLSSSSHAGDWAGCPSGAPAAHSASNVGNFRPSPPSTGCQSTSACIRQGSRKRRNTEPARTSSSPTSSTVFPPTFGREDGAAPSGRRMSEACSAGENFGVRDQTCQENIIEKNSAAVCAARTAAREDAASAAGEAAPVSTEPASTKDTQLQLLRAENHSLHVDNQMLHRRLQTEVQTAEATIQTKLLGERAEWQSERDKYEMRQRMLEKELDRLRDHQTQESTKYEAATRALKEQCLIVEAEQEKKYSRLLMAALEKEKENYNAMLQEKTANHLQEVKEAERRHKKQLEEQRKFFEEHIAAHKQQVTAHEELHTLMKNVEKSAASIEDLTERLTTQAAQENSTISTKMAEREVALKEVEQRLRDQHQQAVKQYSTLVTLATNFRNEQKATEDKLSKERERIDTERAEVVRLRHVLHNAEEEQRKAFESLQTTFEREKVYCLRKQKEREMELDNREQRVKLVEERLRSEKQSLEQQTRSLEEIRARATARLRDIEDEVGEERRRALQDIDAAKSEHLQLLHARQEIELKQSQLQSQQRIVQEEQRKIQDLLDRLQQEGAEVRRLHAEATEARATVDWRGRNLDQKEAKCAEQLQQLQLQLKLVQRERLELLRHENRLLGAGAGAESCLKPDYSFRKNISAGLAPAQLQLQKLVEIATPVSALAGVTPSLVPLAAEPLYMREKRVVPFATIWPQRKYESGLVPVSALTDSSAKRRGRDAGSHSAHSPVRNTRREPSATFRASRSLPVATGQVLHPEVRLPEQSSSTTLVGRLLDRCSRPWGAYGSARQCSSELVTIPNVSSTERKLHAKYTPHYIEENGDQVEVQALESGRKSIRLSANVEGHRRAGLHPTCSGDLSMCDESTRSAVSCGGEINTFTNRAQRSYRRSTSAFSADSQIRSRGKKQPEVHVDGSHFLPRAGSVSITSLLPPASAFNGSKETLLHSWGSVSGRDRSTPSTGMLDHVPDQCRDSLQAPCAESASNNGPVASGPRHSVPTTVRIPSANKCEMYLEADPRGLLVSSTAKPSLEDPSKASRNSGPAADGETQDPPEIVASSISSIISLKSLPSAVCT